MSATRATQPGRPRPLHPFLLAAWPVLFLFAANIEETGLGDVVPPLLAVLAATAVLLALATLALRDPRRSALAVSVVALALLTYGHVENLTGGPDWLLPAWLAGTTLLVVVTTRIHSALAELTTVANGVGAVLVTLALVSIVASGQVLAQSPQPAATAAPQLRWQGEEPARDVYYLVFDRYGSARSLDTLLGIDNRPFLRELESRGFEVLADSHANHLRTAQSLASSLNMDYLLDYAEQYGTDTGDLGPVYARLADHRVGRLFQRAGYRYVHIGSWWDPTAVSVIADDVAGYQGGGSDFAEALVDTSLLAALPQDAAVGQPRSLRVQNREAALEQFPQIAAVAADDGPTFTFAHVLLPHEPYVFAADGSLVTAAQERATPLRAKFGAQLAYTNARIAELVDSLLDVPADRQPIIILQADEGPHPPRTIGRQSEFDWTQATDQELVGKLGILNAWYVPEGLDVPLSADQTPVNSFRLLFNALYGGDFEILPQRAYVFRDEDHVYDFHDVTDVVGAD